MDEWDRDSILRLLESNPDRVEIIEETDESVTFFDEMLEKTYTARLVDPSRKWLDSILHVLPAAEKTTPPRATIVDFLMHLDPAMLAGLTGIYVRGDAEDDLKVAEWFESYAEIISLWEDEQGKTLGWFWADENAVVVNMAAIFSASEQDAREAYPDVPDVWERERDKTVFEQFFLTLAHEIRHAAVDFPLVKEYCRIYGDVERTRLPKTKVFAESDAEDWAIRSFENWHGVAECSSRKDTSDCRH